MIYRASGTPSVADYYRAGLLASALAYLGILFLFMLGMLVDGAGPEIILPLFVMGGLYGALPAVAIAFLIAAPLGCAIGVAMRESLEPGHWHGAINGALTAGALLLGFALFATGDFSEVLHPEILAFVAGFIGIGAGAGWIAQRKVLNWPGNSEEADYEIFE